jgi:UDPglucose 6-dehydrogenase/UDP-N-acetyl-D-galactosamine dehydrogenase
MISGKTIICVIGLGYVGLPLAKAFSRKFKVIGYDIDSEKRAQINSDQEGGNLTFTGSTEEVHEADFIIICVPTPVTRFREPDLAPVREAASLTGRNMKRGSVVILESTVYPGVTEETLKPILEQESGLRCGRDFKIAYCPERINPGDEEHSIGNVTKVVSGVDEETANMVAELYSEIAASVFQAPDIKTAEAAKVIENIQRDLNIALMNELALIFEKMGLNTRDVLDAAATKWNFHRYFPGLVGGHCIPVDPYYLVYKARELGYHPQVILAGRAINDNMPGHVAEMTIKALNANSKVIKGSSVLMMGLTYKENVADTRETPVRDIIKALQDYEVEVIGYDPLLRDIGTEFGIAEAASLEGVKVDAVVLATGHDAFKDITIESLKSVLRDRPIVIDARGFFNEGEMADHGFYYRTL